MKKRNIYQNRSQELLSLFEEDGNSAKVMCVPIDFAKKDHVVTRRENRQFSYYFRSKNSFVRL